MPEDHDHEPMNYEITDAQVKGILVVGVCLSTLALAAFLIGFFVVRWSERRPAATEYKPSPLAAEQQEWTTEARLQDDPAKIRAELEKAQAEVLGSFGTVSEDPPIYRIPIEKAMDIVAERGFPEFKALGPPTEEEQE